MKKIGRGAPFFFTQSKGDASPETRVTTQHTSPTSPPWAGLAQGEATLSRVRRGQLRACACGSAALKGSKPDAWRTRKEKKKTPGRPPRRSLALRPRPPSHTPP